MTIVRNNRVILGIIATVMALVMILIGSPAQAHDIHPNSWMRAYVGTTSESCVKFQWHDTIFEITTYANLCPGQTGGEETGRYGNTEVTGIFVGAGWCVEFRWNNDPSVVLSAKNSSSGLWWDLSAAIPVSSNSIYTAKARSYNC